MSSHNTNHYSHIPASVYNFTDVVGISILNVVDEKITEKNTILDLIQEFNRKKEEESLQKTTEEKSKS